MEKYFRENINFLMNGWIYKVDNNKKRKGGR